MKRHFFALVSAAAMVVTVSASLTTAATAPRRAAVAKDRPVLSSVKELMDSIIDPSADVVWGASGTIIDKDEGVRDLTPTTPEAWHEVRRAAVRLVEAGNLLVMRGREAAPKGTKSDTPGVELEPSEIAALIRGDRKAFDGFARALQALASEAVLAIDGRNADRLMDVGARMDTVCEGCHQTFWYPPKPAPKPAPKRGGQ